MARLRRGSHTRRRLRLRFLFALLRRKNGGGVRLPPAHQAARAGPGQVVVSEHSVRSVIQGPLCHAADTWRLRDTEWHLHRPPGDRVRRGVEEGDAAALTSEPTVPLTTPGFAGGWALPRYPRVLRHVFSKRRCSSVWPQLIARLRRRLGVAHVSQRAASRLLQATPLTVAMAT